MFTYDRTATETAELVMIIGLPFLTVLVAIWVIARSGWAVRIASVLAVFLVAGLSALVLLPGWQSSVEARNMESMKQWAKSEYNIELDDTAAQKIMASGDGPAQAMIYGNSSFVPHWENNSLELRSLLTGDTLEPLPPGSKAHDHSHDHDHGETDDHSDESSRIP